MYNIKQLQLNIKKSKVTSKLRIIHKTNLNIMENIQSDDEIELYKKESLKTFKNDPDQNLKHSYKVYIKDTFNTPDNCSRKKMSLIFLC